ncbi:MAG: DUF6134 family protein [Pseudomonadota bacterium]
MRRLTSWGAALVGFWVGGSLWAADPQLENHFATIQVDGRKIGQVHYTLQRDEDGEIETLKTRASLSILGFTLYSFSQDLDERWRSGELQSMNGFTNDDGDKFQVTLERKPEQYEAVLNGKSLTLPHDAFPNSVWHHEITEHTLLFDLIDLKLMEVEIARSEEQITIDGRGFDTERFDFTGDWQATLWFDQDQQLLKLEYQVEGRDVIVTLDQE